jgi:ferritin-like metal-binding protein YciE
MAIKLNIAEAIPLLRQNLQKEEEMFGWLRANAPTIFIKMWSRLNFC